MAMGDGRWTMDDGRWTMDDGRWTIFITVKTLKPAHFRSCILFPFIVFRCVLPLIITINITILENGFSVRLEKEWIFRKIHCSHCK